MRKAILVLVLLIIAAPAAAQVMPDLKLSGPHFQFNIIGSPKGISGDLSNGRAIMVPLKNANGPDLPSITCEADNYVIGRDGEPAPYTAEQIPAGARLHFQAGPAFAILDRDATDGDATIQVPVVGDVMRYEIYLRVLGKPNTCMDINAFAYDLQQNLYFWAGSVDVNRKTGKSTWVKVNYLFDVWFCQVDPVTHACTTAAEELSVFNNTFEDYFWNILNDGTRNVQVRLYSWDAK